MTSADLIVLIKKQPLGFACGLVSLVVAGVLYFRSSKIDESQVEFEARSAEAMRIVSNVNASKNLTEQVQEIQAHAKEMEGRLVRAGQLAANQQYFYKLEAENDVKLLDVRQNSLPRTSAATYQGIPFSVTVQGSYKQVMVFLNRLENGRHFCHFSSVVFSKTSGGVDAQTMTLTLNLELLGQP
jgi:Tfp pilus assembly protein PilO